MDKTIIDKDGNVIIDHLLIVNNKCINYNYELKEYEQVINYDKKVNELIKPRWNGSTWVEGATEEEIQAWEEENTTTEKEPPEQEKLNAQLLKSNLEFQKALTEQKKVNANLLLQIQSLQKEGNN